MKKLISVFIAFLLGIVTLFGVAGCVSGAQSDLQSKIGELQSQIEEIEKSLAEKDEQIRERDERIEKLERQLGYESVPDESLSEWQKATNKDTFIVSVNITMLGKDLSAEDLAPVNVTNIAPIKGVTPRNAAYYQGTDNSELSLYSVSTTNTDNKDLRVLQEFDFVDFVWRNEYDYRVKPIPSEEKNYVKIQDYWVAFLGVIAVCIDKSFDNRIFTADDFNLPNLLSVDWYTYSDFKRDDGTKEHVFYVELSDKTDTAAKSAQEALYQLDFVREAWPLYAINDFPGIEGEKP